MNFSGSFTRLLVTAVLFGPACPGLAQGTDLEPNNTCAGAQDVGTPALPLVIAGSLDIVNGEADIDFYRVGANAGEFLRVDLQGAASGAGTLPDPLLGLFDTDCNLIALNDDSTSVDSRLLFTVPDNGAFVLAATGYPDFSFQGGGEGSYLLSVSETQIADAVEGRLINALDGSPLPGDAPAFASVVLLRCQNGACFEFVASRSADPDGRFVFAADDAGNPLLAGDYQADAFANGFEPTSTGPFSVADGQTLDLGDIPLTPLQVIGSISGRLVDAVVGTLLNGFGPPYAVAILERCEDTGCYAVLSVLPDEQGLFFFDGVQNALSPGAFRVTGSADDYQPTSTDQFAVGAFEDVALGDVEIAPVAIQFGNVQGCDIPAGGGRCEFSVELHNRSAGGFKGAAWSTVDYSANEPPYRQSRFQVGRDGAVNPTPHRLRLRPGESTTLQFSLDVPGNLPDFSTLCLSATVGRDPQPQFANFGDRFLFCAVAYPGRFEILSAKQARKRVSETRVNAVGHGVR